MSEILAFTGVEFMEIMRLSPALRAKIHHLMSDRESLRATIALTDKNMELLIVVLQTIASGYLYGEPDGVPVTDWLEYTKFADNTLQELGFVSKEHKDE